MRLPFAWMPAAWGLRGPARKEAEAAYYKTGADLESALLDIRNPEMSQKDRDAKILEIRFKHGEITEYEHDRETALLIGDDIEREISLADVELKHHRMDSNTHQKLVATIRGEPWIGIIDQGIDPTQGVGGVYFEFDWNPQWIEFLRVNGYTGNNDAEIVDRWFADVCRSQGSNPQFGEF